MRPRLLAILLLIVLAPIAVLGLLVFRLAGDERTLARQQFQALEDERLRDVRRQIKRTVEGAETELLRELASPALSNPEAFRALARKEPLIVQPFWVGPDNTMLHPPVRGVVSSSERAFLSRTLPIWNGEAALYADTSSRAGEVGVHGAKTLVELARGADRGWLVWYWEEGTHLLFWQRRPDGGVIGAEVERVMLLSRIIASVPEPALSDGRVVLADLQKNPLLVWGPFDPPSGAPPALELALDPPLAGMRLAFYASPAQLASFEGHAVELGLGFGLAALTLALLGLAIYFHRESSRELREAARRVTFVTQVSHELKTPLTNVRLYAELLELELPEEEQSARKRLEVIVSESQRLTRLINNILTFSKQREGKLAVSEHPVVVDDVVRAVLAQFQPALQAKGFAVETELCAPASVLADGDALGQIVGNLVSNVEKYGSAGRWLRVESVQLAQETRIIVQDHGPGVALAHRERIFDPFFRTSHALSEGVTGTGIGLTIARDLARLMGGELRLADGSAGARFELVIKDRGGER